MTVMQLVNSTKQFLLLFISFSLLFTLRSCVNYDEIEIQEVKSVKLLNFSEKGVLVESEIKINNPNSFAVSIVGSELKFSIKGMKIGTTTIKDKIKLKGNTSKYYTLQLESNFDRSEEHTSELQS